MNFINKRGKKGGPSKNCVIIISFGGGDFTAGDIIYAGTNDKDSFVEDINETGNRGYYEILEAVNIEGHSAKGITIGNYFDGLSVSDCINKGKVVSSYV